MAAPMLPRLKKLASTVPERAASVYQRTAKLYAHK
jgi:hypothetical protein